MASLYVEPELKSVGDAREVVLGLAALGFDMWGGSIGSGGGGGNLEFQPDHENPESV